MIHNPKFGLESWSKKHSTFKILDRCRQNVVDCIHISDCIMISKLITLLKFLFNILNKQSPFRSKSRDSERQKERDRVRQIKSEGERKQTNLEQRARVFTIVIFLCTIVQTLALCYKFVRFHHSFKKFVCHILAFWCESIALTKQHWKCSNMNNWEFGPKQNVM